MGYYADIKINQFTIPAKNVAAALSAMSDMHKPENLTKNARGGRYPDDPEIPVHEKKWYSWVENPNPETGWPDLKTALDKWGFEGDFNEHGDFVVTHREYTKLGQEEEVLRVLAPFTPGLEVECVGEDDSHWRWIECDGKLVEQGGSVVYGDS